MASFDALRLALGSAKSVTELPLADTTVRVKPPMEWPASAMEALNVARFTLWAEKALVDDLVVVDGKVTGSNDVAIWQKIDPTIEQVLQFFAAYEKTAGANPEK